MATCKNQLIMRAISKINNTIFHKPQTYPKYSFNNFTPNYSKFDARSYGTKKSSQYALHTNPEDMYATTILSLRKGNKVVIIGDGQVSRGNTVVKPNAKKIRVIKEGIISGFAGSTADALTLFEKLEQKLEEYPDQLLRACVELAKMWRTDKILYHLDAELLVADKDVTLVLSGDGDVFEPAPHGVVAIGSGSPYAQAAAMALMETDWDAERVARRVCYSYSNTIFY